MKYRMIVNEDGISYRLFANDDLPSSILARYHEAAVEFWQEIERLRAELADTIASHQKQNTVVAEFEAVFCDKHLDELPEKCPACREERLRAANAELLAACKEFAAVHCKSRKPGWHECGTIPLERFKETIARCEAGREGGQCT